MGSSYDVTRRNQVKRLPERASYDRATIHEILDASFECHVGFLAEGKPVVIPSIHVRIGQTVYLHGSPASRMLRALADGGEACVAVTLVDGLVLARSAMHHSMNYRSVVIFGKGIVIDAPAEKLAVLKALTDHLIPGRWNEIRQPTTEELRRTMVVGIAIDEASAKIRCGPPIDDPQDDTLPFWAGVLPIRIAIDAPVSDPKLASGIPIPTHVSHYRGPGPVSGSP